MGFFRKKKRKRRTADDCRIEEHRALDSLIEYVIREHEGVAGRPSVREPELIELMTEWAEWRELRARIEGENESDVR